ncbi:MAG: hypothetical protein ABIP67_17740 [Burkholderiales bacterium]
MNAPSHLSEQALQARAAMSPLTRLLLEGPVVSTLLRLALPNILVMFAQAATRLVET